MRAFQISFQLFAILIATNIVACGKQDLRLRKESAFPALGVEVKIVAFVDPDHDFELSVANFKKEFSRLNLIFSNYTSESEIAKLSLVAPVRKRVSPELDEVLKLSYQVFKKSGGAFDPSIGPVTKIWAMARKRNRLPDPDSIRLAMENVGWATHVIFENQQIGLSSNNVKLDFGGIAKGYIADQIVKLASQEGIDAILVDVGGDIAIGGPPPNSAGWKVTINSSASDKPELLLSNCGIATSGDSQQRIVKQDVRYSHIIDPRSGNAVTHSYLVTVVAKDCATADAYASALSVLEVDKGIELASNLKNVEARIEIPGKNPLTKKTNRFGKSLK